MPKATVDKHSYFLFVECKVGFADEPDVPTPSRDTVLSKDCDESQFRRFVTLSPYS